MPANSEIAAAVKNFILSEFLEGEDPDQLSNQTPLMTSGVLDSIATLKLVSFLEQHFGISIAAHEADTEHLNTIDSIAALVASKSR